MLTDAVAPHRQLEDYSPVARKRGLTDAVAPHRQLEDCIQAAKRTGSTDAVAPRRHLEVLQERSADRGLVMWI